MSDTGKRDSDVLETLRFSGDPDFNPGIGKRGPKGYATKDKMDRILRKMEAADKSVAQFSDPSLSVHQVRTWAGKLNHGLIDTRFPDGYSWLEVASTKRQGPNKKMVDLVQIRLLKARPGTPLNE